MEFASILGLEDWRWLDTPLAVSILVMLATFMAVLWCLHRKQNLPPSVTGEWPLIGHLPSKFRGNSHLLFTKWAKEYGDVYRFKTGLSTIVVVSGYKTIKKTLEQEEFSTRVQPDLFLATGNGGDIFMAPYGTALRRRRKFAANALMRVGMKMGQGTIEDKIQEEAQYFCAKIAEYEGEPVDIAADLAAAASNIICALSFGRRFDYGDPQFRHLKKIMDDVLGSVVRSTWAIPFVTYVPGVSSPMADIKFNAAKAQGFFREEIQQHRLHLDPENPRDFTDYYLLESDRDRDTGEGLREDNLVYIISDFFVAGTDTIAVTLRWFFLYMVLYPDVQKKVQAEIDSVLDRGTGRPGLEHRGQLPYTVATIKETMRVRSATPVLSVPRKTSVPTRINGFDIPAGTTIFVNFLSALMDPTAWPEPDKFDPSRFQGHDGQVTPNPPAFLPFSTGKRRCLGEQLAKKQLFLIVTTVLQQFTLKLPDGSDIPSTDGVFNKTVNLEPPPFRLCAVRR